MRFCPVPTATPQNLSLSPIPPPPLFLIFDFVSFSHHAQEQLVTSDLRGFFFFFHSLHSPQFTFLILFPFFCEKIFWLNFFPVRFFLKSFISSAMSFLLSYSCKNPKVDQVWGQIAPNQNLKPSNITVGIDRDSLSDWLSDSSCVYEQQPSTLDCIRKTDTTSKFTLVPSSCVFWISCRRAEGLGREGGGGWRWGYSSISLPSPSCLNPSRMNEPLFTRRGFAGDLESIRAGLDPSAVHDTGLVQQWPAPLCVFIFFFFYSNKTWFLFQHNFFFNFCKKVFHLL